MSKATVTRLFIGGALAVIAGSVLAIAVVWTAIANDVFVMNGADIVGLRGLSWPLLGLGIIASVAVMAGLVSGLVSWIGALLNTAQLQNKAWFLALLLLGIFSLGVIAMIAYVLVGPDGSINAPARRAQVPAHG